MRKIATQEVGRTRVLLSLERSGFRVRTLCDRTPRDREDGKVLLIKLNRNFPRYSEAREAFTEVCDRVASATPFQWSTPERASQVKRLTLADRFRAD